MSVRVRLRRALDGFKSESGSIAVETAIAAPIVIFFFLLLIDFGFAYNMKLRLLAAAGAGAVRPAASPHWHRWYLPTFSPQV